MRIRNKPHTLESLLELTQANGECLDWQGSVRNNGYGVVVYKGKQTSPYRLIYEMLHGVVLSEQDEIDHTCNNRLCINPAHLQRVSHAENTALAKARRITCRKGHPWNEENTYTFMVTRENGKQYLQRYCRACRADHQKSARINSKQTRNG